MNAVHEAHGGEEFVAIGYLIGTGRNLMTEEPKMKEVVTSGGKAPAVEIHNEDNVAPLGKQKRETEKNEEETNQAK